MKDENNNLRRMILNCLIDCIKTDDFVTQLVSRIMDELAKSNEMTDEELSCDEQLCQQASDVSIWVVKEYVTLMKNDATASGMRYEQRVAIQERLLGMPDLASRQMLDEMSPDDLRWVVGSLGGFISQHVGWENFMGNWQIRGLVALEAAKRVAKYCVMPENRNSEIQKLEVKYTQAPIDQDAADKFALNLDELGNGKQRSN